MGDLPPKQKLLKQMTIISDLYVGAYAVGQLPEGSFLFNSSKTLDRIEIADEDFRVNSFMDNFYAQILEKSDHALISKGARQARINDFLETISTPQDKDVPMSLIESHIKEAVLHNAEIMADGGIFQDHDIQPLIFAAGRSDTHKHVQTNYKRCLDTRLNFNTYLTDLGKFKTNLDKLPAQQKGNVDTTYDQSAFYSQHGA